MKASVTLSESVVELVAREQQELAIKLKDEGQEAEAIRVMDQSNSYLRSNASLYGSQKLMKMEEASRADTAVIKQKGKGRSWSRTRKHGKRAYSSKHKWPSKLQSLTSAHHSPSDKQNQS